MAMQLATEEIKGKRSYLDWLREKSGLGGTLSRMLYEKDYKCIVPEDKIQMEKAAELRRFYACEVGGDDDRLADRLWKSVHNPCSLFEMMLYLSISLNEILVEEEEDRTKDFFRLLLKNSELDGRDDEDYDYREAETVKFWEKKIDIIVNRTYSENGKGGLFPLQSVTKNQKVEPIWYQLNAWIEENSDENGAFSW